MAALSLLLLGCSRGDGMRENAEGTDKVVSADSLSRQEVEVRKEFVILRELTKQHTLQSEVRNAARLKAVERHLSERLDALSDEGLCDEEREILQGARAVNRKR